MRISDTKLNRVYLTATVSMTFSLIHLAFCGLVFYVAILAGLNGEPIMDVLSVMIVYGGFTALGVMWFLNAKWKRNFRPICVKYIKVLKCNPRITISGLATILGEDVKKVRKNINYMVNSRCVEGLHYSFKGDYVSEYNLVQPQSIPQEKMQPQQRPQQKQINRQIVRVSVTCESCCGITMLPPNTTGICDYCGSKIKS